MIWQMLIGPLGEIINTVLKRLLPPEKMSEEERAKLEAQVLLELSKQDFSSLMAQIDVNKTEAAHASWFVAGWRPYIGWICGTALAWHFIIQPLLSFSLVVFFHNPLGASLPVFDMDSLMTVLMGMLGLGAMRSFEKWAKVSEKH